ncbi:molybdenum cofactor guanylyltransferase [Paenibacillus nanensis]|uniref:Probable molybdenum cofactor guanylyltransferase n=1 Tax=Paenibacillus nanensis TaxID=393251 RepID=A0A3A1UR58_9BACL|nr:molybdenum cofactor guanylyltransferase [Paenibacillus nanensis]RIX50978.1 molybdenum cofactor guanylyltransferase [Paenibacillus nanensis]
MRRKDGRWPFHSLILAGGRSSRMGTDKAMLPIDGEPLLARLAGQLLALSESVTIAAGSSARAAAYREALNGPLPLLKTGEVQKADRLDSSKSPGSSIAEGRERLSFVEDIYPGDGPLAGLHAGLSALPEGYVFVIACDMPAVSEPLLARLAEEAGNSAADVVHVKGQPFHALYHTRMAAKLREALESKSFRVMQLLRGLHTAAVEGDAQDSLEGLMNLNTPEDYRDYIKRMRRDGR